MSFFGSDYDPFDENEFGDNNRRKKTKFGRASNQWKFTEQSSSPESTAETEPSIVEPPVIEEVHDARVNGSSNLTDLQGPVESNIEEFADPAERLIASDGIASRTEMEVVNHSMSQMPSVAHLQHHETEPTQISQMPDSTAVEKGSQILHVTDHPEYAIPNEDIETRQDALIQNAIEPRDEVPEPHLATIDEGQGLHGNRKLPEYQSPMKDIKDMEDSTICAQAVVLESSSLPQEQGGEIADESPQLLSRPREPSEYQQPVETNNTEKHVDILPKPAALETVSTYASTEVTDERIATNSRLSKLEVPGNRVLHEMSQNVPNLSRSSQTEESDGLANSQDVFSFNNDSLYLVSRPTEEGALEQRTLVSGDSWCPVPSESPEDQMSHDAESNESVDEERVVNDRMSDRSSVAEVEIVAIDEIETAQQSLPQAHVPDGKMSDHEERLSQQKLNATTSDARQLEDQLAASDEAPPRVKVSSVDEADTRSNESDVERLASSEIIADASPADILPPTAAEQPVTLVSQQPDILQDEGDRLSIRASIKLIESTQAQIISSDTDSDDEVKPWSPDEDALVDVADEELPEDGTEARSEEEEWSSHSSEAIFDVKELLRPGEVIDRDEDFGEEESKEDLRDADDVKEQGMVQVPPSSTVQVISIDDSDDDEITVAQSQTDGAAVSVFAGVEHWSQTQESLSPVKQRHSPLPLSAQQLPHTIPDSQATAENVQPESLAENVVPQIGHLEKRLSHTPPSARSEAGSPKEDIRLPRTSPHRFLSSSAPPESHEEQSVSKVEPASQPKDLAEASELAPAFNETLIGDQIDPRLKNRVLTPNDTQPRDELSQKSAISLRSIADTHDLPTPQLTQKRSSDILLPASLRSSSPAIDSSPPPVLSPEPSPPPPDKGIDLVSKLRRMKDRSITSPKPAPRFRRISNIPVSVSPWFAPRRSSEIVPDSRDQSDAESEGREDSKESNVSPSEEEVDVEDVEEEEEIPSSSLEAPTEPSSSKPILARVSPQLHTASLPPSPPPTGLRTFHGYYAPLSSLASCFTVTTSTISIVVASTPPARATS
ncbi:MAG: hypothetical protein Q9179_007158, partial [Wetmoreana sp. 5 TL-2023]